MMTAPLVSAQQGTAHALQLKCTCSCAALSPAADLATQVLHTQLNACASCVTSCFTVVLQHRIQRLVTPYAGDDKADDGVLTGQTHVFTYHVPDRAGPGPAEPSSKMWMCAP